MNSCQSELVSVRIKKKFHEKYTLSGWQPRRITTCHVISMFLYINTQWRLIGEIAQKESTADRMSFSAVLERGLILHSKGKGWLFQDWLISPDCSWAELNSLYQAVEIFSRRLNNPASLIHTFGKIEGRQNSNRSKPNSREGNVRARAWSSKFPFNQSHNLG